MRSQGGAVDHSQPLANPNGGDALRRGVTQPALHDDLMERVLDSRERAAGMEAGEGQQGCARY